MLHTHTHTHDLPHIPATPSHMQPLPTPWSFLLLRVQCILSTTPNLSHHLPLPCLSLLHPHLHLLVCKPENIIDQDAQMRENVCVLSSWVALVFHTDFPLAVPLCYSVFSVSDCSTTPLADEQGEGIQSGLSCDFPPSFACRFEG